MKKIRIALLVLIVAGYLLAGCATAPPPPPTKTGKPDVTIQANKAAVFDAVTDELLTAGYTMMNVNETKDIALYVIQYPNLKYSGVDSPVDERATINFVQTSTGVRVLGSVSYVTASGVVQGWPGIDYKIAVANGNLYNILLKVQNNLE